MPNLGYNDFVKISKFTQMVYTETDVANLPVTMLKGLRELIPFEHCSYNEINSVTNATTGVLFPHVPEVFKLLPAFEAHASEHPIINNFRDQKLQGSCKTTDFITQRRFREMGIYRDFFRHVATENQLSCQLSEPGAVCDIAIAINRSRTDFTERDRTVLNLLRPHLMQARQNALAFAQAEQKAEILTKTLEFLSFGIISLTSEGKISWITHKAIEFCDRYFPGELGNSDQIPDALNRWAKSLHRRLGSSAISNKPPAPYVTHQNDRRLTVRLRPEIDGGAQLLLAETQVGHRGEMVQVTGLTPRENQVLHWVALGKTNSEIGTILGVSPRTVDKHTQHIFEKLGVENRAAAMRHILASDERNC